MPSSSQCDAIMRLEISERFGSISPSSHLRPLRIGMLRFEQQGLTAIESLDSLAAILRSWCTEGVKWNGSRASEESDIAAKTASS